VHGLRIIDFTGLDPDDNAMIEGEAIETLAAIGNHARYAHRFLGHVKVAYLDPPYNTGRRYKHYLDKIDPFGWNTHLKELLAHVRRFLADDGSVWLQLNDSEQHRARLVLDEVFGPENFVATVIWVRTRMPRIGLKPFATRHDYIHVYRKSDAFRLPGRGADPVEAIWSSEESGSNELAAIESSRAFQERFSTPKPEQLLRRMIELATEPGDLVLDCFAGSGTTPAVAHKLGRRWISVEVEPSTIRNFLKPRMQQVVEGTDPGEVSPDVDWSGGGGFTHLAVEDDTIKSRGASPQV
jgi:adenine-specific DNA-methyltransferase